MGGDSRQASQFRWKELLNLGEQLVNQVSVAAQRHLILDTAASLLDARAELWLAENSYRLPGSQQPHLFPLQPPNELMQAAFQSKQTCTDLDSHTQASQPRTLAIPLITNNQVLGALQVQRQFGTGFSADDVDFSERMSAHIAGALRVSLQSAIKGWRYEQLALVRSVSAQIANLTDMDELTEQITRLVRDTFQYYYVAIFTTEEGKNTLQFRACAHNSPTYSAEKSQPDFSVHYGEGIVGSVAQTGTEIIAQKVGEEPRYRFIDSLPETRAEVALPLKVEDRVLGVLDVQSDHENAFHEIDILVLQALSDNIALAIEGIHLYSRLRRRAEQLSVIADVSRAITSILDLEVLLDQVVNLIRERFGYPFVHLFTVHPGRRLLIYRAGSGEKSRLLKEQGLSYDLDDPAGIIPWVARNGKSFLANDVEHEPLYRPSELPPLHTRAELAVPLNFGGEVYGVLDIQSDERDNFAEDDRFLFEALADNISIAIRNATLYRSERWRRQVADSLRDVAGLLSSEMALNDVLDVILVELEGILPSEIAAIWFLDQDPEAGSGPGSQRLHLAAVRGVEPESMGIIESFSIDNENLLKQALHADQPVIRSADDPIGPLGTALGFSPDYASIAAPLRAGEKLLGVLALAHRNPGRYGSEAQAMTAAFASYAAVAIQNNRLFTSSQEQAWVSTIMLQVAEAAQRMHSLDELLGTVVRLTPMLVGVKSCAIFSWNPAADAFTLQASYGLEDDQAGIFENYPIYLDDNEAFRKLYLDRNPVIIPGGLQDVIPTPYIELSSETHPLVLFPLAARDQILGVFLVEQSDPQPGYSSLQVFDEQRLAILQGIVQQTAIAVENIGLLEGKQEEAYVTAVLLQAAQAVVSSNNLDDILEAIVHLMPILVGINACVIYLWDEVRNLYQPAHVFSGSWEREANLLSRSFAQGEYPVLDAVREQGSLVISPLSIPPESPQDWHNLPNPDADASEKSYLDHKGNLLLGFPLAIKGSFFGVLLAQELSAGVEVRERRLEIITGIAQQAALAIQNDRLTQERLGRERLDREIQLAREIQQTFLPSQLPSPPGWELDVRWRTARQMGGDFYDCFELPDNRLGLVIADVSDKGIPAALYMTVARTLIRAAAIEAESPAEVLKRVNNLLLMDSRSGMFVTCIYAVVSLDDGMVRYANAGHNLPLLIRGGESPVERLEKGGTALGAWEDIPLLDRQIFLNPGDFLLLYTDGVTETFGMDYEIYGEERLIETIRNNHNLSAGMLLGTIDASLAEFLGDAPPSDDVTLMAIHRHLPG